MNEINQNLSETPRPPRIVAVSGAKGSGKDELAQYLVQQYDVPAIEIGEFARQLAAEAAADEDAPHLRYDVSAKRLAEHGTPHIMQQLVAELSEGGQSTGEALIITGIRTPAEAAALKENFGPNLMLAFVKVGDPETRYDRLQALDRATDLDDFQDFVQEDAQLKADYALQETAELADIILWNNESLEAYHQRIENDIVPHLFPEKGDKPNELD